MSNQTSTAQPPERPHKIYHEEENLLIYHQGGRRYLAYHKACEVWKNRVSDLDSIWKWYESFEANRLKRAGGVSTRERREGLKSQAEIDRLAKFCHPWVTAPWALGEQ